ncbi:hypothetical protein Daus18300_002292 [Diaporthe australafricana]|uniref:Uncharacterized protein n=1 Tax=Diaporthe australafricana TaxID=127596 RepID=A0ABR3XPS8_9PEZI
MDEFDGAYDASIITKVEGNCLQIDNLYSEWNIDTWAKTLGADMLRLWTVSMVAFTGYLSIIYMLRRATAKLHNLTDPNATDDLLWRMPLVQSVSYKILDVAHVVLRTDARFDVLCILFGCFNIHLPYSYVAHRLIEATDIEADEECVTLLDDIAQIVQTATGASQEAAPLGIAFQKLNAQVQTRASALREQDFQNRST